VPHETLGRRLQRLRHAVGLSQSQAASVAGLSIGTLRNWERDRREPLLGAVARLAQALGCTLDELAGLKPGKGGAS
jgi:transcriptional regulator with XRE-family HTH domain